MIPKECKRLAEVDFPIAVVSKHAASEKYVRSTPNTALHPWWAQRPLAACRAMLLGLLFPDPYDRHCPTDFKEKARELLPGVVGKIGSKDLDLRQALIKFIGEFSNWNLASDRTFLGVARDLVKAAHSEETPLVVDPFAGAGTIPLEALRLGCETFASDLNPVACLILKVMLEDIPRHGSKLAEEFRKLGAEIKAATEKELAAFYPPDPDGAKPIAYLWARTVRCESPNCGAEIPLIRSFWLCKKTKRNCALRFQQIRSKGLPPHVEFEIFKPEAESQVPSGTVTRAKATCLCCENVLPPERVRAQLINQRGGADVLFDERGKRSGGSRLLAVVTMRPGKQGRDYRLPIESDYKAVWKAQKRLNKIIDEWESGGKKDLCPVPDEALPPIGTLGFRVQRYGMLQWSDLFTARQKLALVNLSTYLSAKIDTKVQVLKNLCAFSLSKFARHCNGNARWNNVIESVEPAFGQGTLPITWTFPESIPWGPWAENFDGSIEMVAKCLERGFLGVEISGQVQVADACESPLPDYTGSIWFTDPPYYDAIPYADLSDFFFVRLKRALPNLSILRDPFDQSNPLTPKMREIVQDDAKSVEGRKKDRSFFEQRMTCSFSEGRRIIRENGIASIVFAHKTTEGWEALLSGMTQSGLTVTGSWPISTERSGRLRARESAALSASIHLVCRPRPEDAPIGDWGEVLHELPKKVGDWVERLQSEGIRGADLVFACIGPALEIFSRYSKVETAEGREVKLAEFLEKVWEVVGRTALEQILGTAEAKARNGLAGALEEDARLTALFLWTLQSTNGEGKRQKGKGKNEEIEEEEEAESEDDDGEKPKKKKPGFNLIFDVVRRFAQPLGIHLPEWEGRIIETEKGVVRLLSISERSKQLFGEEGFQAVADKLEKSRQTTAQLILFPQGVKDSAPEIKGRGRRKKSAGEVSDKSLKTQRGSTTLDRVHAAMLLQASGRANALRALLKEELERGPDFLRLANALSALYPKNSEEKRLLDAMLLAMPR